MKVWLSTFAVYLAFALGGCVSGGGGVARHDPAGDYRSATHDAERLRYDLLDSKPEDPFHDMNQRQLNWALERQGEAIDERFRILERKADEPPPPPSPPPMRWTVRQEGGSIGFAVNPGNKPSDGLWTNWAEQGGRKLREFRILDGVKEGNEVSYYASGKTKSETLFRKGTRDGPSSGWRANGTKAWERHYKNDVLDGIWTQWNDAGEITSARTYKAGQLIVDPEQAN